MSYICNHLEEARARCEPHESIWAIDVWRNISGTVRQGKASLVANRASIYNKMIMNGKPTTYEVILKGTPVFLYLDIDITLDNEGSRFTFDEINHLIIYIKAKLVEHLNLSFNEIEHEDICIL